MDRPAFVVGHGFPPDQVVDNSNGTLIWSCSSVAGRQHLPHPPVSHEAHNARSIVQCKRKLAPLDNNFLTHWRC